MNDLTVSTLSAPAPLDPQFAPESPGVSSPTIVPSSFALAIVPLFASLREQRARPPLLRYRTVLAQALCSRPARIDADREAGGRGRKASRGVRGCGPARPERALQSGGRDSRR